MRWTLCGVAAFVVALDLWTKHLVVEHMALGETIRLPLDFLQLTYVRNVGAAFGILPSQLAFFVVSAVAAILCIWFILPVLERMGRFTVVCGGTVLGGAIGNLIDRMRYGYVVDFLDLKWWPVFNVADIGITVGITCLVVMFCRSGELSSDSGARSEDNLTEASVATLPSAEGIPQATEHPASAEHQDLEEHQVAECQVAEHQVVAECQALAENSVEDGVPSKE